MKSNPSSEFSQYAEFGEHHILIKIRPSFDGFVEFGCGLLLAVLLSRTLPAQQITVGANVHVSSDRPTAYHRELWAGAHLTNPDRLIACAMADDIPGNNTTKTRWYVSHDRGKAWKQTLEVLKEGDEFSADNVCEFGPNGVAYAIALGAKIGTPHRRTVVYRSPDGGLTWDKKPAIFPFIDRETFAADNTGGKFHGRLYVLGQEDIPGLHGKESRAIQLFRSLDEGRTFLGPALRFFPRFGSVGLITGHAAALSDGTFIAPMFMPSMPEGQERPRDHLLVVIRSTDGGETLEPEIKVADLSAFGLSSLAVDGASGKFKDRLYVVWADSSRGRLRVLLSVSTDKGKSWSSPRTVDDTPSRPDGSGPDVVLPVVKVNREGVVGVSWYDKRDVPNNMGWDHRFAASLDGGETFTPSVRVSAKSSVLETKDEIWPVNSGDAVGTRDGVAVEYGLNSLSTSYNDTNGMAVGADGTFHPVWVDNRTGIPQVWTAAVRVRGTVARHGAPELATLVDVSDKITIKVSETAFDRATGMLTGIYQLKNTSSDSLLAPLKLRLVAVDGELGPVSVHKADNNMEGVGAVWDFTALVGDRTLAPDEESQGRKLTFTIATPRRFGPKGVERDIIARPVFRVLAGEIAKRHQQNRDSTVCRFFALYVGLLASATPDALAQELPLKPTRTIEFTTTEGTWTSLDVSPDGRTIVFDMLGDLYTMPIAGGKATRLTHGLAWDESPRFSPNGRRIAFTSDRSGSMHLWVIDAGGSGARRVTRETVDWISSPAWAPDSRSLVARRKFDDGGIVTLWQYDVAQGTGTELVAGKGSLGGGAFSPDGRTVYFSEEAENNFHLLAVDRQTRKVDTLVTPSRGGFRPLVSPDGQWLVYVAKEPGGTALRLRDRRTGRDTVLAAPVVNDTDVDMFDGKEAFPGYAFTPDSRAVVVASGGKLQRIDVATRRVTGIPFEVHVRAELGPLVRHKIKLDDGPLQVRQLRSVNASPEGRRLTFAAVGKIWLAARGQSPRRLTTSALLENDPVFSPDGQWIAFVTWSDEDGGALWKIPVAGGSPVQLTAESKVYAAPRWTPDGSRIVFLAAPPREWGLVGVGATAMGLIQGPVPEIAWVRAEGGPVQILTQKSTPWSNLQLVAEQFDDHLTVSGDGSRVFYLEAEDKPFSGKLMLRSVGLERKDVRSHARIEGRAVRAVPSPDGQWLALQDRWDIHLVPFATLRAGVPSDQETGLPLIAPAGRSQLPITPVTTEGGVAPYWSPDGTRLMFSRSHEFYDVALAEAVAKKPRLEQRRVAIELRVSRPLHSRTLLLRGARLVTMAPSGVKRTTDASGMPRFTTDPVVIERGDVLIAGRRIVAVGPSGSLKVPADATVMEMAGKTIIPGLIGTHEDGISMSVESQPRVTRSWGFAERVAYGVTTVQAPVMGYVTSEAVERVEAGDMLGPRIFNTVSLLEPGHQDITSQQQAEQVARKYKALGFHLLKLRGVPQRIQQQWLSIAAARVGMNATAHGKYGGWGQMLVLVLDGLTGWEHDLTSVSPIYRDVVEMVGRSGTFGSNQLVRGFLAWESDTEAAKMERFYPPGWWRKREFPAPVPLDSLVKQARNATDSRSESTRAARELLRAGTTITVGSHSGARAVHAMMWNAVMLGGMTPTEALRVGTLNGARAIGVDEDVGSIEAGKIADLVILNRNPLENIRHTTDIVRVVKDGVVYNGETLDTVWPVAKPFAAFTWQRAAR